MDPLTAVNYAISTYRNLNSMMSSAPGGPFFGIKNDAERERKCENINVFASTEGVKGVSEQRRFRMNPNSSMDDVKLQMNQVRVFDQKSISDENNFLFTPSDFNKPLSNYSNDCCLRLKFVYDSHVAEMTKRTSDSISDAGETAKNWLFGKSNNS